ncbi:hypothetical protein NDU88_002488 [Pleurodeles waltl]|uniref:Uncharacterized protein n=1 Tax=Pleurodeles waltl TaxID=8319 RepID=A0AAV7UWB5_PLEWA|nr:hypothetical protein NDU88_002488 [Pleurodeles waltl]
MEACSEQGRGGGCAGAPSVLRLQDTGVKTGFELLERPVRERELGALALHTQTRPRARPAPHPRTERAADHKPQASGTGCSGFLTLAGSRAAASVLNTAEQSHGPRPGAPQARHKAEQAEHHRRVQGTALEISKK